MALTTIPTENKVGLLALLTQIQLSWTLRECVSSDGLCRAQGLLYQLVFLTQVWCSRAGWGGSQVMLVFSVLTLCYLLAISQGLTISPEHQGTHSHYRILPTLYELFPGLCITPFLPRE